MKITTSELYAALDQCEEIVFTETEQLIALGHILFAELSSIGLHPAEVNRLTGATLNYYQRADQYQFSTDNQILYSGTEQECYSVWSSIGNGLTKAAAATTRVTAGTKKALSAGFNKASLNYRTGGLKSTFKGVGSRMSKGYSLGFKTKMAQQTQNLANKNIGQLNALKGGLKTQFIDMSKSGNLTNHAKTTLWDQKNQLNAISKGQQSVVNEKGAGSRSRILSQRSQVNEVSSGLRKNGATTQATRNAQASAISGPAKPTTTQVPQVSQVNQTPTTTQTPKPYTPSGQTNNMVRGTRPFESGGRGLNASGLKQVRKEGGNEFMARMRNSKGNIMGINTQDGFKKNMANIGNWAASNKVQAGVVAAGTAALGYGAYRMLRGPRQQPQQPQQQQQPIIINNNH